MRRLKSLFVQQRIPQDILDSLEKHFGKVYVHFNHFIKAVEDDVASPRFLLGLLARGAGLICAKNQEGIDGVILCLKDGLLERGNVLHMTIHIRNCDMSRKSADWQFDPATLKYAADDNVPAIRILLNLGAQFPHFECKVTREHGRRDRKAYAAIDFYCAGLSAKYLKPIAIRKDSDNWREEAWKGLLGTVGSTRSWEHLYEPPFRSTNPAHDKYLRKMTPSVATKKEFWRFFWEEVD